MISKVVIPEGIDVVHRVTGGFQIPTTLSPDHSVGFSLSEEEFETKADYAKKVIAQKAILILDNDNQVLTVSRTPEETKDGQIMDRITKGGSVLLGGSAASTYEKVLQKNIKNTPDDLITDDHAELLITNNIKSGYAFFVKVLKLIGPVYPDFESNKEDKVCGFLPIAPVLEGLSKDKPMEYNLLRYITNTIAQAELTKIQNTLTNQLPPEDQEILNNQLVTIIRV